MACALAGPATALASRPSPRRINTKKQPSVAEVQRAIGVANDPLRASDGTKSSFMDLIASTPIGQAEGPAEKKLREAAEWMVDRTEARARTGQQILLVTCMKIFPLWLFLFLIASGTIKLPFDLPLLDDLLL